MPEDSFGEYIAIFKVTEERKQYFEGIQGKKPALF